MQICDDDSVEVFRSKSCYHAWKIREAILIYGERTILLLVIDVQENYERVARAEGHEVRNGLIKRIAGFLEAILIGVPHGECLSTPVQGTRLVSQAKVVLIERHGFVNAERVAVKLDRPRVLLKNISTEVGDR